MFVMGTPAPQGSKRGFIRGGKVQLVESSKAVTPWREAVVAQAMRDGLAGRRFDGDLALAVDFYFDRPRGHYGTGRNAQRLRPGAPRRPNGKPDLDKLLRSTLDALTQAGVIVDDCRIVTVSAGKHYTDDANPLVGARVQVIPL